MRRRAGRRSPPCGPRSPHRTFALIPRIDIPVTLTPGASQLYAGGAAEWQLDRLRHGRIRPFATAGHAPHLEASGAFNALLADLCKAE
ncbi:MAG: hypothetical protein HPM95_01050 [Alphaproteobacteria bacterium]|nr:hypothetical protein [Alphaproteobacteria bacterium]